MDLVFVNQGLQWWLEFGLQGSIYLGAYTNTPTVGPGLVLSGVTEAAWTGYAGETLNNGSFTYTLVGNILVAQSVPFGFFNGTSSPQTINGIFYRDNANTVLLAAAAFSTPQIVPPSASLPFVPTLGNQSVLTS